MPLEALKNTAFDSVIRVITPMWRNPKLERDKDGKAIESIHTPEVSSGFGLRKILKSSICSKTDIADAEHAVSRYTAVALL
ncbi:hypothetical protein Tco_0382949 [Tanacetum coccineum]